MRKLFTVDFAVWELYIGTACAVAIFSDYILTRDFFVRQFKGPEGYILICRGSFGLYNGKRSVKDPSKKVKKAENGHYFTVQSLPSPFHIEKTYASFLTTSLPL